MRHWAFSAFAGFVFLIGSVSLASAQVPADAVAQPSQPGEAEPVDSMPSDSSGGQASIKPGVGNSDIQPNLEPIIIIPRSVASSVQSSKQQLVDPNPNGVPAGTSGQTAASSPPPSNFPAQLISPREDPGQAQQSSIPQEKPPASSEPTTPPYEEYQSSVGKASSRIASSRVASSKPSIASSSRAASSVQEKRSSVASSQAKSVRASSRAFSSVASSVSSSLAGTITPPAEHPPGSPFDRANFGYTVPVVEGEIATPQTLFSSISFFWINLLIALLSTAVLGLSRLALDRVIPSAPAGVITFLRRLPVSLAIFLAIMLLKEILLPRALAQGFVNTLPSPAVVLPLYGIFFFVIAGITNFVFNNLLGSEGQALERLFLPVRRSRESGQPPAWRRSKLILIILFLLYAAIGSHINTAFSLLPTTQLGIVLIALSTIIIAAYCKDGIRFLFAKRFRWQPLLEANVLGILFALLSVWLTRTLGLAPGYLFGVPAGVIIVSNYYSRREGPFEWSGLLSMLVVAAIAWMLIPFASGAQVVEDFLKLLVIILLEACFFESLPFANLAGRSVYRWRRAAWVVQCTLATFLLLHLLWNPSSTIASLAASPPGMTYVVLLALYACVVALLFLYCKARRRG